MSSLWLHDASSSDKFYIGAMSSFKEVAPIPGFLRPECGVPNPAIGHCSVESEFCEDVALHAFEYIPLPTYLDMVLGPAPTYHDLMADKYNVADYEWWLLHGLQSH